MAYSDINQYAGMDDASSDQLVRGVDAVFQHLDNLILIRPGELLFRDTGIDLEQATFKLVDEVSAQQIYSILHDGVLAFEPRIELHGSSRIIGNRAEQTWDIRFTMRVRGQEGYETYTGKLHHRDSGDYA